MAPPQPGQLASGETFGRFLIERRLGAGAFGVVYKARDIRLDRIVALKVLQEHRPGEQDWGRLLQEARTGSALAHPNICAVYDAGEESERAYIAMEYVEGRTLSDLLGGGGLALATALDYGAQIVAALAHAHQRGVIHRDLKASNVMITAEGRAKLLDFGLARRRAPDEMEALTQSRESLAEVGGLAGTLPYVAPEVLRGKPATAQSDLWAFGVLLYEMLTGELPFKGRTPFELSLAIMTDDPAPLAAEAPAKVRDIVGKCLERDCEKRYSQGAAALADLRAEQDRLQRGASPSLRLGRHAGRRWALAAAGAAVALGLAVAWSFRERLVTPPPPMAPIQAPVAAPVLPAQRAEPASAPSKPAAPSRHAIAGNPEVLVWVNKKSKVYHCPGDRWYRKARNGVAMTQRQAEKTGFRPARGKACP